MSVPNFAPGSYLGELDIYSRLSQAGIEIPNQTDNENKFLMTNGTEISWETAGGPNIYTENSSLTSGRTVTMDGVFIHFNGTNGTRLKIDDDNKEIRYTADTHKFTGVIEYNGDGKLLEDTVWNLNSHSFKFEQDSVALIDIGGPTFNSSFLATDGTAQSALNLRGDLSNSNASFSLGTSNGVNIATINGDGILGTVTHMAQKHIFNNKIFNSSIIDLDFADDDAALIGGVEIGQFYNSNGVLRIMKLGV